MAEELTLYTGKLNYKDIDFTFVFDGNELKLIPPKEKEHEIEWEWGWKTLESGAKTWVQTSSIFLHRKVKSFFFVR